MKQTLLLFLFVSVFGLFSNAAAQVLIENFRNFDCANCKLPDEEFEKFINANPDYKATIIYYHNRDPFIFDPFFLAAKDDILMRNSLYSVAGNPTVHVNGYYSGTGGSTRQDWETNTTDAAAFPSPATTEISRVYNGDSAFTITVTFSGSSIGQEVRPYVLIAESGIVEPNSKGYGLPKSGLWDNIFRDSLAPVENVAPFVLNGSKSINYAMSVKGKNWKVENLRVVAFLQSTAMLAAKTFPIIGVKASETGYFEISSVKRPDLVEEGNAYPNPFSSSITIPFTLKTPAHVTVRISDLLGRDVATVLDQPITHLESSATFAPRTQIAGTYVASIFVDGVLAGTQKLVYHP
jgi:hypothetical protein